MLECAAESDAKRLISLGLHSADDLAQGYYQAPEIRQRMIEFLGGTQLSDATAAYITATDGYTDFNVPEPPTCLERRLDEIVEIDRSLWDQASLIAHIDLEHHNFDHPEAAWLAADRAFQLQQPVLDAILAILRVAGIAPLILVSGRGYHLVWSCERESRTFERLATLGRLPATLQGRYARGCSPSGLWVDSDLARAFAGLGLIMEYLWQRVFESARTECQIPIQPAAIEVGDQEHGREIVSFDLSEYGDPLDTRRIRLPFSVYLKPRQFEWLLGRDGVDALLPIFEIPLAGMALAQAIEAAHDPELARELARQTTVRIPNASVEMSTLLDAYERSRLAAFHEQFYRELDAPPRVFGGAPACAEWLFRYPNDWLLRPAALQHAVRVLTALGCNAAGIVDWIYGAYLKDCNWGDIWTRLDPLNRAAFYTRLFQGMIATGTDQLIDFNCVSHKEKGFCMIQECGANLADYRERLRARRQR